MILNEFSGIKISGIAAAVPNSWVSIDSMITDDNKEMIEKFRTMTGVNGHYSASELQTSADFSFVAAKHLLVRKGIDPQTIQAVVFVTQTADYAFPASACVIHHRLGLSKECIAFDVNLGCSGYTYGVNIIASMMASSNIERALLLVADTTAKEKSRIVKTKVGNAFKMLFGDAGTATLLEKTTTDERIDSVSCTDGSGFRAIIVPFTGYRNPDGKGVFLMNDIDVFNFSIKEVPRMVKEYFSLRGTGPENYDSFVLHQANLYMMQQIAKRTKFPMDKVPVSIDLYGNTSSASIPVTLANEYGNIDEDRTLNTIMCGFGVGLSWSLITAKIRIRDIFPVIKTEEYFLDGYENETNL